MPNTFQKCLSHVGTASFIFRNAFPASGRCQIFFRSAFPTSGQPTFFSELPFPHRDGMFYFSELSFPHRDSQLFFQNYISHIGTARVKNFRLQKYIIFMYYETPTQKIMTKPPEFYAIFTIKRLGFRIFCISLHLHSARKAQTQFFKVTIKA